MGIAFWTRIPDNTMFPVTGDDVTALADFRMTRYAFVLERINDVFTLVFCCEMFIKLMGWGFRTYWADYWNKLDFFLVIASIITFVFEHIIMQQFPLNASIFRILRLARLTKAMKAMKTLRRVRGVAQLIDTLILTLPAMANVAA